jgi:hypothetical protein
MAYNEFDAGWPKPKTDVEDCVAVQWLEEVKRRYWKKAQDGAAEAK